MTRSFNDITLQNAIVNASYAAAIESELPPEMTADMLGGGNRTTAAQSLLASIAEYARGGKNIELIEDEFDLPAVPWCWIVFGSEGRLEQTFVTDQDNGLLFVPPDAESTKDVS